MRPIRIALVLASLLAAFSTPVHAASVVVQDPVGVRVFDPVFASISGTGFEAVADVLAGHFGAAVDVPGAGSLNAQAGLFDPLRFTNTSSGAVPFPIAAGFSGDYDLVFLDVTGAVATQVTGVLSARIGGLLRFASATHDLRIDAAGSTSTITSSSSGGTVAVLQADLDALIMTLAVPGLTLNPGETIEIGLSISTTDQVNAPVTGTGKAAADFCCSAQLSLLLPPGVQLENDTGRTLAWVTSIPASVPEPSSALLFGSAAAFYGMLLRSRRAPHIMPRATWVIVQKLSTDASVLNVLKSASLSKIRSSTKRASASA
jgi:hypothetical protein